MRTLLWQEVIDPGRPPLLSAGGLFISYSVKHPGVFRCSLIGCFWNKTRVAPGAYPTCGLTRWICLENFGVNIKYEFRDLALYLTRFLNNIWIMLLFAHLGKYVRQSPGPYPYFFQSLHTCSLSCNTLFCLKYEKKILCHSYWPDFFWRKF